MRIGSFGILAALALPAAAHAALLSTDNGLGVYDTTNNVTWTSDGNLMATQAMSYTNGSCGAAGSDTCTQAFFATVIADSGGAIHDTPNTYVPTGSYTLSASDFTVSNFLGVTTAGMTWWGAQAWVHYLDVTNYGGSNQWALPSTVDAASSGSSPPASPAASSSQLAQLFYGGLGQVPGSPISTTHNSNFALFNLPSVDLSHGNQAYWSGTQYSARPDTAWIFFSYDGGQGITAKTFLLSALAVAPGQVGQTTAVTPLPAGVWLLLSGLGGLGVYSRKREPRSLAAA